MVDQGSRLYETSELPCRSPKPSLRGYYRVPTSWTVHPHGKSLYPPTSSLCTPTPLQTSTKTVRLALHGLDGRLVVHSKCLPTHLDRRVPTTTSASVRTGGTVVQ